MKNPSIFCSKSSLKIECLVSSVDKWSYNKQQGLYFGVISSCWCWGISLWLLFAPECVCLMSSLIRCCSDPDPSVTRGLTHSLHTSTGSGAYSRHLPIGCCLRLVGQSIVPALPPSPFRSHCFLRPLSFFLYHRLIHPATRALSGPVSLPAVFRGDESRENREREGGMKKRSQR